VPALSKKFAERNLSLIGVIGAVVVALIVVGSLQAANLRSALTESGYHARFTEAGGLREGDDVRVSGLSVGRVDAVTIESNEVDVAFSIEDGIELGDATRVEIKSATVLGRKYLQVTPAGEGEMQAGDVIPAERTLTPYDVQSRLEGLGGEITALDDQQLSRAIGTVAETLEGTPAELRTALDGIARASRVITKRDDALLGLLDSAASVSKVLAGRSSEVTTLVKDANSLLNELTVRRAAIRAVLVNANALVAQVKGLTEDNARQIGPSLRELKRVNRMLVDNDANITAAIEGLRNYTGSLGEAVNGGPWFYGYIANLVPTNLAQQTVDSLLAQIPQGGADR
jgi:phospholipid/cholesterol/gamma-HCH transport system substrate-binding protein